jgi:hypothetical protein
MVLVSDLLEKEGTCIEGLMVSGDNLMVLKISVLQSSRTGKCLIMDTASKITG